MKVFFDTNVYISEALVGGTAEEMIAATRAAKWRVHCSPYVLDEVTRVLVEKLGFTNRLAALTRRRIIRLAQVAPQRESKHRVPDDPKDSPILRAALGSSVDYLVTNDRHLLSLDPIEGLRIISMTDYLVVLKEHGLLK